MNVTDQLADLTVARHLLLLRLQANETRKIDKLFADIADSIQAQLNSAKPLTEYQGRRLNAQIKQLTELVNIEPPDLSELAEVEAKSAVSNLAQVGVDATLPTAATLQQISSNVIIQGAVIDEWFRQINENTKFEISRAVKAGIAQGMTNQQILKSIVGIKSQGDKGAEVLKTSMRHASTITRTAVQTIANEAAYSTYLANDDVIKGVEHVSTLDSRTTITCAARDGCAWDLNGKQFKGNPAPFMKPPLHFNCRSILVPVTKTFKELGIDKDEIPQGTRSTQYGAVRQSMKFEDFMNRQPKSFVEDVLGVGRYEIYKDKKLTLNQLLDTRALKPLTLTELKEKYGDNAQ